MIHIWLKNNEFHILRDVAELKDLIESEMGEDVALQIQKLIDNSVRDEVLESIETIILDIQSSKRLNKNEILKSFEGIRTLIENEV